MDFSNFDLERLLEILLYDERVFYGSIILIGLLVLLLLFRILRVSRVNNDNKLEERRSSDKYSAQDNEDERDIREEVYVDSEDENGIAAQRHASPYDLTPPAGIQLPTKGEVDARDDRPDTEVVYRTLSTDAEGESQESLEYLTPGKEKQSEAAPLTVEDKPAEESVEEEAEEDISTPATWDEGLEKTKKAGFVSKLNKLFFGKNKIDDNVLEELEEILYTADIGPTATKLFEAVTEEASRKDLSDPNRVRKLLKKTILSILEPAEQPYTLEGETPQVIMMVGVNGVGKTTTIGKLTWRYMQEGKKVMLAAADTFRAAAVEQLCVWGDRNKVPVIKGDDKAPPASIVYNAVQAAKAQGVDVLIVDTAGRLHTKYNLMEEMKKMRGVVVKTLGREPDHTWLVIDANTGQNAVNQTEKFHEDLVLTGLVLTKLDGTAKGGVVIAITDQLGLPIHYIGIGEGIQDLRPFSAKDFTEALF